MSRACRYPTHREAAQAGWFSRRHETDDAHRQAQDAYRLRLELKAEREQESREATAQKRAAA
jgi:hypothetical protein